MRIVSLIPSATEILFAIGAEADVVGVAFECDHPPAARERRIVSTSAMPEGLTPKEIDDFVAVAVAVTIDPHTLGNVLDSIAEVGRLTSRVDEATALVASLEARLAAVAEQVADRPRPRATGLRSR